MGWRWTEYVGGNVERMPSFKTKSEDFQSIRSRLWSAQNPDGSFPEVGSVLSIVGPRGVADWTADVSLNSVTLGGSGTLTYNDASGLMLNGGPVGSGGFTPIYSVSNVQGEGGGTSYTFYNNPKYIVNGLSTITGYIEYAASTTVPSTTYLAVNQGGNSIWYASAATSTSGVGYFNFSVILQVGSYSFTIANDNVVFTSTPILYLRAIRHV
jgi:hypothetical protein